MQSGSCRLRYHLYGGYILDTRVRMSRTMSDLCSGKMGVPYSHPWRYKRGGVWAGGGYLNLALVPHEADATRQKLALCFAVEQATNSQLGYKKWYETGHGNDRIIKGLHRPASSHHLICENPPNMLVGTSEKAYLVNCPVGGCGSAINYFIVCSLEVKRRDEGSAGRGRQVYEGATESPTYLCNLNP